MVRDDVCQRAGKETEGHAEFPNYQVTRVENHMIHCVHSVHHVHFVHTPLQSKLIFMTFRALNANLPNSHPNQPCSNRNEDEIFVVAEIARLTSPTLYQILGRSFPFRKRKLKTSLKQPPRNYATALQNQFCFRA